MIQNYNISISSHPSCVCYTTACNCQNPCARWYCNINALMEFPSPPEWIYSPSTDRIIQISGHMLRQSVMGSDLSYEDLMDDKKLTTHYNAQVTQTDTLDKRTCWILDLTAKEEDVSYFRRKIWVDKERFVPLRQELYAKSGTLLKRVDMKNYERVQGRWYPKKFIFKDMLKNGKGTEFIVESIRFDVPIPSYIFSKASLRR